MEHIKIKFHLKDSSNSGESLILLKCYFNRQRFVYSTGLKIMPMFWSKKFQRPITERYDILKREKTNAIAVREYKIRIKVAARKDPEFRDKLNYISKRLKEYTSVLNKKYEFLINQNIEPTKERLKEEMDSYFKPSRSKLKSSNDFFIHFDQFIAIKQQYLDRKTILKHLTLRKSLIAFQQKSKQKICFDLIDMNFYEKYKAFLLDQNLLDNTIAKYFSSLKTYMNWALEMGWHQNLEFKKKQFSAQKKTKRDIFTLTKAEIQSIFNLDLSSNKRLDRVKDLFQFSYLTGQRISDIVNFDRKQLKNGTWVLFQVKFKKTVRIPIYKMPEAEEILKKYNLKLPTISEQNYNKYLKEIGKLAGLEETYMIIRTSGNKRIQIKKPRYEWISSLTARSSRITHLLEDGASMTTLMNLTGHSDVKTLMRYGNRNGLAFGEMLSSWK
jgi:site-specific recombinase XerD